MAKHRTLAQPLKGYRIGDPAGEFPIFSGEGAKKVAARWHQKGQEVIYAADHLSLAMLEKLVHHSGRLPRGQHYIEITIPAGTSYEVVTADSLPRWYEASCATSRPFGTQWLEEKRTAILIVPSVVVRLERNILINPLHADFKAITPGLETPITWDDRLFAP
ncbi:MAG: hypothetical protein CTY20_00785 [Hyphomicrobium sp.]|nr:MAG: hypothetical protein CTY20_00785 [Hyphomicrobium sp.]